MIKGKLILNFKFPIPHIVEVVAFFFGDAARAAVLVALGVPVLVALGVPVLVVGLELDVVFLKGLIDGHKIV